MHLALAAEVELQTRRLHSVVEAASVEGAVVAVAEEAVAVVVVGQVQGEVKVEVEATEGAAEEEAAATNHTITRGKVKTRRNRRITIESEDTTKKMSRVGGPS